MSIKRTRRGLNRPSETMRMVDPQHGVSSQDQQQRKAALDKLADQATDWLSHAGAANHKEITLPMVSLMRYCVTGDNQYLGGLRGVSTTDRDWVRGEFVKFSQRHNSETDPKSMFACGTAWYKAATS